jgi:hypothetical protein
MRVAGRVITAAVVVAASVAQFVWHPRPLLQISTQPVVERESVKFVEVIDNGSKRSVPGYLVQYPPNDGTVGVDLGTSRSVSCRSGDVASPTKFFARQWDGKVSGAVCRVVGGLAPGRRVKLSFDVEATTPQAAKRIEGQGLKVQIAPAGYLRRPGISLH